MEKYLVIMNSKLLQKHIFSPLSHFSTTMQHFQLPRTVIFREVWKELFIHRYTTSKQLTCSGYIQINHKTYAIGGVSCAQTSPLSISGKKPFKKYA